MKQKGKLARAMVRRRNKRAADKLPEPRSPEELARACMQGPPKEHWRYTGDEQRPSGRNQETGE